MPQPVMMSPQRAKRTITYSPGLDACIALDPQIAAAMASMRASREAGFVKWVAKPAWQLR